MPFTPLKETGTQAKEPTKNFTPFSRAKQDKELIRQGEEAKEFMELPFYKKLFTKQFARELPGAITKVLYEQPAKFVLSAGEVPQTFATGKAEQKSYDLPGLKPFKSFQSEAADRAEKIRAGELPVWTALIPFVEVPLAGAELLGIAQSGKKVFNRGISFLQKRAASKVDDAIIDLTQPILKKQTKIQAFEQSGKPGGATISSKKGKIKIQPTAKDRQVAASVVDIVDPKKNPIQNLNKVNKAIEDISETQVTPFLKNNPRTFNIATIESKLNAIEPPDIIKSDVTLKNTYNLVRQRMIETIRKGKKDMFGLWGSRKEFDNIVADQFGDIIYSSEKNTAVKRGVLDMRRAVNEFIGESVGDSNFSEYMNQLNNMYIARHNIAEKSYKLFETTARQRFFQSHPLLKKVTQTTAIGGAGAVGGIGASKLIK